MKEKIKVLVVDDASFMIKAISEILNADPEIEVVGSAKNGLLALSSIKTLKPDAITLDVDMPIMDGLRAVRHIMLECPVPIVMLSSLFSNGAITFEALRLGVVDFLPKPSGAISQNIHSAKQQIVDRIKVAASVSLENIHRVRIKPANEAIKLEKGYGFQTIDSILLVGTNLGGPNTSIRIFSELSPDISAAAIIVHEISPKILPSFVKEFNKYTNWSICEAMDGAILEAGVCYVASDEYETTVSINNKSEPILRMGEPVRDPLNRLFNSASAVFGANTIGLLLTGVGNDGSEGFTTIKSKSGLTLAQKSSTCVYPNLTECAIERGVVDRVLSDPHLVKEIEFHIKNHSSRLY